MKSQKVFILHIQESIERIESFSKGLTREKFLKDELRKSAILRELEVIGEATKNLSSGLTSKYPDIEWRSIAGLRDKLIHHYFGINFERVWKVISEDLPKLKKKIKEIIDEEGF